MRRIVAAGARSKSGSEGKAQARRAPRPARVSLRFQEQIKGPENAPIARFSGLGCYQTRSETGRWLAARVPLRELAHGQALEHLEQALKPALGASIARQPFCTAKRAQLRVRQGFRAMFFDMPAPTYAQKRPPRQRLVHNGSAQEMFSQVFDLKGLMKSAVLAGTSRKPLFCKHGAAFAQVFQQSYPQILCIACPAALQRGPSRRFALKTGALEKALKNAPAAWFQGLGCYQGRSEIRRRSAWRKPALALRRGWAARESVQAESGFVSRFAPRTREQTLNRLHAPVFLCRNAIARTPRQNARAKTPPVRGRSGSVCFRFRSFFESKFKAPKTAPSHGFSGLAAIKAGAKSGGGCGVRAAAGAGRLLIGGFAGP